MPRLSDIAYYEDPYGLDYADNPSGFKQTKKFLSDVGRGVGYAPFDLLGASVDIANLPFLGINWATGKKIFSEKPVAGSDSLIEHGNKALPDIIPKPKNTGGELIGRIGASAINPAGAVRGAIKATIRAEDASVELMRRITKNPDYSKEDLRQGLATGALAAYETNKYGHPVISPLIAGIIKPTGGKQYQVGALDVFVNRHNNKPRVESHLQDLWAMNAMPETQNALAYIQLDVNRKYLAPLNDVEKELSNLIRSNNLDDTNLRSYILETNPHEVDRSFYSQYSDIYDLKQKQLAILQKSKAEQLAAQNEISKQFGIPTLDDLDAPRRIQNEWANTVLRKYAQNLHGTADDPALKLLQQGVKDWYQAERTPNPSRPSRFANIEHHKVAGVEREPISPKSQREARLYERNLENDLVWGGNFKSRAMPINQYVRSLNRTPEGKETLAQNPWLTKTAQENPNQPFFGTPQIGHLSKALMEEVAALAQEGKIKLTPEGKLDPNTSSQAGIEAVLRTANERILAERALEGKDKEALDAWAKARYDTIEKPMVFPDGDAIAVINQNSGNLAQIRRDLSLQTCELNHCVGSAGHTGGKYTPMVMPHTGKPPKSAEQRGLGTSYATEVSRGETEIHSLLDKAGKPKLTMQISPDGTLKQIKGASDKAFPAAYRKKVIDYLNSGVIDNVQWSHGDDGKMNKIFVNQPLQTAQHDFEKVVSDEIYDKILQMDDDDFYGFMENMWSKGMFMDYKEVASTAEKLLK